ncbi:hypothetical protein E2562_023614 [Oryza meyeriana var. granulata]|uniref:GIR1-like zinc ribbon domain-containing protein n=1 Tax=Oryza meyeriana var. granulata TaxID=110450 RepID=A0A6G1FBQ0_9ORYZ|nr:hypothetical protein E2562_023614 [Oryza meyeriana var. granulata]
MSRGSNGGGGGRGARGLDLKLNLSLPAARVGSPPGRAALALAAADDESSPSSCLSSESELQQHGVGGRQLMQWSDSTEATSMVLAACPRCFIYVMLAEADPRCPKCRSPVILDFLHAGCGGSGINADGRRHRRG